MRFHDHPRALTPLQERLWRVIFLSETRAARRYDLVLLGLIGLSVLLVALETVSELAEGFRMAFYLTELALTVVFTVEYGVRLWVCRRPLRYATSFFGVIDLLSVLPTYVSLVVPGTQVLLVVRILRVLRIFRILKLAHYLTEADQLRQALAASRRKIAVFVFSVLVLVTVAGAMMYMVEGGDNGFDSIPRSVYWAVVTLTTVGYGDISPATPLGQALALVIMIMGYGIIAVPTGIVTVELNRGMRADALPPEPVASPRAEPCPTCGLDAHDADARYCKRCGTGLSEPTV